MSYTQIGGHFALALEDAANGHDAGDYTGVHSAYDALQGLLPSEGGPEADSFHIALWFFDGWGDAHNHDWLYYDGISQRDWPRLARTIAGDLRASRPISEAVVLRHFDFRTRKPRASF